VRNCGPLQVAQFAALLPDAVKALVHSLGGLVNSMRRYGEEGERHRWRARESNQIGSQVLGLVRRGARAAGTF
jgi:hypothetical protein